MLPSASPPASWLNEHPLPAHRAPGPESGQSAPRFSGEDAVRCVRFRSSRVWGKVRWRLFGIPAAWLTPPRPALPFRGSGVRMPVEAQAGSGLRGLRPSLQDSPRTVALSLCSVIINRRPSALCSSKRGQGSPLFHLEKV